MAKNDDKKITVVAECLVSSVEGIEKIVTFSKSWARSLELPRPVEVAFSGFVRKD